MNKLNSNSCSEILNYVKPSVVYMPINDGKDNCYDIVINIGDYVYKGDVIAINKKDNFPIHSPISGFYVYRNNKILCNGKISSCMVIENDFKERYRRNIIEKRVFYSKKDFVNLLYEKGIVDFSDIYLKYNNIKYLLINAAQCNLYVNYDKGIICNYCEEILECIDNILEIMNIPFGIIVINDDDRNSYNVLIKYLGTYPNIKLKIISKIYSSERLLIKNIFDITYDNYPSEKGIIVNNISTIYAIYESFKYNKPLIEKTITVVIPSVRLYTNIKVKIGTLASDVLKEMVCYDKINNPLFIVGDLLNGNSMPCDDVVITKDVNSIFVIENNFEKSKLCIKCGKCIDICPADINPVLVMNNKGNINKLNLDKCTKCGLCSYVCPSKIEVMEFIKERMICDEI